MTATRTVKSGDQIEWLMVYPGEQHESVARADVLTVNTFDMLVRPSDFTKLPIMVVSLRTAFKILTMIVIMLYASLGRAQTLTNADLHAAHVKAPPAPQALYDALKAHEYRAVVENRGPLVSSTPDRGATLSPWEWPVPAPARRLDGTSLDMPPAVYGDAYPWFSRVQQIDPSHCCSTKRAAK